jgi:predicted nucleic acid-binding protein
MLRGLDTTFLVESEVAGHAHHRWARTTLATLLERGDTLALAPQVLAEFVHVITDSKRFSEPLTMDQALARAELWWQGREVVQVFPGDESSRLFLAWMRTHQLGRKRLLDTQLAATYFAHGIHSILSSNARDYTVFDCFEIIRPK